MRPIIEVQGLRKTFEPLTVLDNISFSVTKGEILSILGPSGAGKTTLLKCLIGLSSYESAKESILIGGLPRDEYLVRQRIAYVPQRYSNYPWLNVFENIKMGMAGVNKRRSSAASKIEESSRPESLDERQSNPVKTEKNDRIKEIVDVVGLSGFEKYSIDQLSGGMQQRVAIGRALAQNTDIIALDEPFGALDFKIRGSLQLLVKRLNKTVLFVTHDIEEAIFVADKLIVLSKIPTSITNHYQLPFRSVMEPEVKFDEPFIRRRREIQHNLTQPDDLIRELRATGTITSVPIDTVLSFPFLDALRNQINENTDRELILNLIKNSDDSFRLGVMLLRSFRDSTALNAALLERFGSNHLTAENKFFLLHELSFRVSEEVARRKMWDYISQNFDDYRRREVAGYFGGARETVEGCQSRLYKPEHKNKYWIYLVSLAATGLREAKQIIEGYIHNEDQFVSFIARELLENTKWK